MPSGILSLSSGIPGILGGGGAGRKSQILCDDLGVFKLLYEY